MFGATALGQPAAAKPAFNFSLGGTTAGAAPAAGGLFGTTQPGETHCEHMSFFTGSVWTGPFLEKNDLLESSAYLKRPVVCDFTIITTITSFSTTTTTSTTKTKTSTTLTKTTKNYENNKQQTTKTTQQQQQQQRKLRKQQQQQQPRKQRQQQKRGDKFILNKAIYATASVTCG